MKSIRSLALYTLIGPAIALGAVPAFAQQGTQMPEGAQPRTNPDSLQRQPQDSAEPRMTPDRQPTMRSMPGEAQDSSRSGDAADRRPTSGTRQGEAPEGMQRGAISPDGVRRNTPRDGYLARKPASGFHAEELIGSSIRTRGENADVGPINDLIIDENGQVVAVIVGVGGFLGMGEKDVAIGWDSIQRTPSSDGFDYHIDASRAALGNAPTYSKDR